MRNPSEAAEIRTSAWPYNARARRRIHRLKMMIERLKRIHEEKRQEGAEPEVLNILEFEQAAIRWALEALGVES